MTATTEQQHQALNRAANGQPCQNDLIVIAHYAEQGIEATPRVDVFTYNAWKALGRQVRKGEHGCRLVTWIPCKAKNKEGEAEGKPYMRKKATTVFHVSQTEAIQ